MEMATTEHHQLLFLKKKEDKSIISTSRVECESI
jgi:hypothetical protein